MGEIICMSAQYRLRDGANMYLVVYDFEGKEVSIFDTSKRAIHREPIKSQGSMVSAKLLLSFVLTMKEKEGDEQ